MSTLGGVGAARDAALCAAGCADFDAQRALLNNVIAATEGEPSTLPCGSPYAGLFGGPPQAVARDLLQQRQKHNWRPASSSLLGFPSNYQEVFAHEQPPQATRLQRGGVLRGGSDVGPRGQQHTPGRRRGGHAQFNGAISSQLFGALRLLASAPMAKLCTAAWAARTRASW